MPANRPSEFAEWFGHLATDASRSPLTPWEWQETLASDENPRSRVIRIPTGYGKTLGVLGAWLYHRVERGDDRWPRRLVWVLPMRALVEQVADEVRNGLDRLGLRWRPGTDHKGKVGVHLLMGGIDQDGDWNLFPEDDAVLIATQDMALSRALNRGYATGRARWPAEFGLLSHDALWVLDEIQLMDVGLATSSQIQAFLDDDAKAGRGFRPRLSWWMSATLQPDWLKSVDTAAHHAGWTAAPTTLTANAFGIGIAAIRKSLESTPIAAGDHDVFAKMIKEAHEQASEESEYGRITLVICNTVDRASRTYDALGKLGISAELRLVHSRFRAYERTLWKSTFLSRESCMKGVDRIIVATQVVEAGVDISATTLVTDLSPWSSLVQRFGRCARYDGSGKVIVVDRGRDEKMALPYSPEELEAAVWALDTLCGRNADASIASIEGFEQGLTTDERERLYPYRPKQLLLRRDLEELFDTTPDLTGADIDVSSFIRSGDERDLSVFWMDIPPVKKGEPVPVPSKERKPARKELCNVPFLAVRDWLCGKATKEKPAPRLLTSRRAWVWDWIDGEWKLAERADLVPGVVVCVSADTGGYNEGRGFDAGSRIPVSVVAELPQTPQDEADNAEDSEQLSAAEFYKTIATHTDEVVQIAARIVAGLVPDRVAELIDLAARWHDIGKSHPAFQSIIESRGPYSSRVDLAKAPEGAWQWPCLYRSADGEMRRGFRHELASCLALFDVLRRYEPTHAALLGRWSELLELTGDDEAPLPISSTEAATEIEGRVLECTAPEFDLLAYLVLSHHGKVRVSLNAGPKDQEYSARDDRGLPIRGVRDGDTLPVVSLDGVNLLPAFSLTLAPAALGLSPLTGRSWSERTIALLETYGPGALAYLEALLTAADRRASKLTTADPLLAAVSAERTQ